MLDELSTNLFPPLTGAVFAKVFVREQERKKLRRRGRRGGKECAKGGKEEREGEGERERKSGEGFGSITGRILLITGESFGATKRNVSLLIARSGLYIPRSFSQRI